MYSGKLPIDFTAPSHPTLSNPLGCQFQMESNMKVENLLHSLNEANFKYVAVLPYLGIELRGNIAYQSAVSTPHLLASS